MKALVWHGTNDVRVERVPDPTILNARDAIIKITTTAICGSDLHLLDGFIPTMQAGDILGHEFMGEVVEVGKDNKKLKVGDRVVVPFTIACGGCFFCGKQLWSLCDNSNPNAWMAEKLYGYSTSGLFGYSHMTGGYAGGQAQYVRVPFADVGPLKIPDGLTRRAGAVPLGHLPDRLHGRRELRHPAAATRSPCGAAGRSGSWRSGARSCSAPSASSRSTMCPSGCAWRTDGGAEGDRTSTTADVFERAQGDDRRARPGCVHRRRRHGSARPDARRLRRQGQDGRVPRDRPPERAAPGDSCLPQGRHRLDPRRLRRLPRQDPVRRRVPEGADLQDGADPHDEVHAAAARPHRARRDRSVVRHHAPHAARRCAARPTRCSATSRTTASRSC